MAEEDKPSGGRGDRISGFLTKKTGPLPNAAWLFIVVVVVFYFMKSRKTATPSGTTPAGGTGTFTSSQSSTDPTTGAQSTYTATGPSTGFLNAGGGLTGAAGVMPYTGGGDVFVNYPGQTTAPAQQVPQGPKYPPVHATPAPSGATGAWWVTLPSPTPAANLANVAYNMGIDVSKANPGQTQILAADLVNIMAANPQINWAQLTANPGNAIPAGTAIYVPLAGGNAGIVQHPPSYGSLDAPQSYQPPPQLTSMITAVN